MLKLEKENHVARRAGMKTARWMVLGVVVVGMISILGVTMKQNQDAKEVQTRIQELWKKVDEAQQNGLPQTAIGYLKNIRSLASQVKSNEQLLKAVIRQIALEGLIEGNKPAARILRLKEEIAASPEDLQPMLKLVMARWYWHYFQRNRWRFMERTETAGLDEKDFTTWDLPRLYREIDSLYRDVLKADRALQAVALNKYHDFLIEGDQPQALRPTLYDFAAWEALEFYTSAEQAAAKPEDAFEVQADSAAFAPAREFMLFKPETTDADSPKLQALRIYQDLLSFHIRDSRPDAFLDVDLARLRWVRNVAVGEGQSDSYMARLKELAGAYPGSELSSQALYLWAQELSARDDPAAAFEVAGRGQKAFPESLGGRNCQALLARIQAKEFELKAESVVMPGRPSKMVLGYRNIERIYFRLVAEDYQAFLQDKQGRNFFGYTEDAIQASLKKTAAAEWTVELKPTADFKRAETLVSLPVLKPGYYLVLASLKKDFSFASNKVQAASFWVSNLGFILCASDRKQVSGYVVRNQGGEPVPAADVALYEWDYRKSLFKQPDRVTTDEFGFFSQDFSDFYTNRLILVTDKKGEAVADTQIPYGSRSEKGRGTRTVFFTDRSLYRPGQMIHFKGICLSVDQEANNYQLLPGRRLTVTLLDVNDEKVSSVNLVSNEFGSVSGTFTAPADRLTGKMTIACSNPEGSATVRVEEYKRPKFQVKIEVPDKEFRLGQEAEVNGEATAYTGAPVDEALVRFRVVREVNLPYWWYWWFRPGKWGESQEIAHGTTRTDAAGKFTVRFAARPDPSVPKESQPSFTYTVSADVTDSAGETRSAEGRLRLGTVSLEAAIKTDDWLEEGKPVALTIITTTLNGKPAAASGKVEIYSLKGPDKPVPQDLIGEVSVLENEARRRGQTAFSATPDWRKWPEGALAAKRDFETSASGQPDCVLSFDLKPGAYKARLRTKDKFGAAVEALRFFVILDPGSRRFSIPLPFLTATKNSKLEVGQTFEMLWATGYEQGPLLLEVFRDNKRLERLWTPASETQGVLRIPVKPEHKGGFTVIASLVKDNRLYRQQTRAVVPWSDKMLKLEWMTFRSKLLPGQKETWTLKIIGPGALPAAAEMVASLYDASLDQFYPHDFPGLLGIFSTDQTYLAAPFVNRALSFASYGRDLNRFPSTSEGVYAHFPEEVWRDFYGYEFLEKGVRARLAEAGPPPPMPTAPAALAEEVALTGASPGVDQSKAEGEKPAAAEPDLSKVAARKNLNETAFFFPHLLSDKDGTVSLEFTMPEALTQWRFLGLAHTKDLASGLLEATTVTQKDLMVQPNPPRFLREGDLLEFTVKVTNMTEAEARGAVQLNFSDPVSEKPRDAELGNKDAKKAFVIPAKQSRSFSWAIQVPEGLEVLAFKAVGATDNNSDGEEGWLPVLSRRIFIQEAIPLWISGQGRKSFTFAKLAKSAESKTLRHQGLTVQMTSNPAWYAVQALPFLMEFPYECSEQVFNRLYANSLAQHIAASDPKIRRVFDQWKGTEALKSNLEKNQELKSILLQESPWIIEAKAESQAKQRVGLLFDENRLSDELKSAFRKLEQMQDEGGAWPWFPGGRPDSYITLYIVTGFGRLKHLGVTSVSQKPALAALDHLDGWVAESYEDIVKNKRLNENNLSSTVALYLYGRSFFLEERPIPEKAQKAVNYFLDQAKIHWLKLAIRQSQGHLALALNRFGFQAEAQKIMRSIKERSQVDEEMGRFWSEQEFSWWWYLAPIETQALMIEAFDEVMNDRPAVEECKIWLLKQKQTRDWKTTKATADAIYGLLLRGENLLASQELVEVILGGEKVEPERAEAGTGYYEKSYGPQDIKPAMADITLVKKDKGIAWGGVHWSYLEDIAAVTPHAQNPLRLKKTVFVKRLTKKGPVIEPVAGPLEVGDTVTVRIELRSDRDMEYVHLKDHRGSGLEPVNVLSHYKYQDGLWYYESTKDTATHFFIDILPKGTYVFEYPLKVVHRGSYQNGLAHIECMYAPEFNSHSESTKLEVR
jgi:uncharacterized protein YfaS (alpha-2-macroglobulin family)